MALEEHIAVVERFRTLTDYEARLESGEVSELTRDLFVTAVRGLHDQLEIDVQSPAFQEVATLDHQRVAEELDVLETTGVVDTETIQQRRSYIYDLGTLSARFLGTPSIESTVTSTERNTEAVDLNSLLEQSAEEVAANLLGKAIRVGNGQKAIITKTFAQDASYNKEWADDPVFGENRVDAQFISFRGNRALYVRAGDSNDNLQCVRITGIELDGVKHNSGKRVCEALGITEDCTASLQLEGTEDNKSLRIVKIKTV